MRECGCVTEIVGESVRVCGGWGERGRVFVCVLEGGKESEWKRERLCVRASLFV